MKSDRFRMRISGLTVVLCVVLIFLNLFMLISVLHGSTSVGFELEDGNLIRVQRSVSKNWETLLEFEPRTRKLLADTIFWNSSISPLNQSDENSCDIFRDVTKKDFLASGWTKAVYRATLRDGSNVAVKMVNPDGHDVGQCMQKGELSWKDCYRKAAAKIVKEIVLLKELAHPNILKVLGHCVLPDVTDKAPVAMVTELGEPLDVIKLLRMSWEDRLRITLGLARLVAHLATGSKLGSLAMNDFRRQQFILAANGEIKLTDVDDLGLHEPVCHKAQPCQLHISNNTTLNVSCDNGHCVGYNERLNLFNVGRQFVSLLLPHGVPGELRPLVDEIIEAFTDVRWAAVKFLMKFEDLADLFISGKYFNKTKNVNTGVYRKLAHSDLPGLHDYRCYHSLSGNGCTLSVYDVTEAKVTCSSDPECRGFVMTNQKTWTGRYITHFKNNVKVPVGRSHNTTLYVKVSS